MTVQEIEEATKADYYYYYYYYNTTTKVPRYSAVRSGNEDQVTGVQRRPTRTNPRGE